MGKPLELSYSRQARHLSPTQCCLLGSSVRTAFSADGGNSVGRPEPLRAVAPHSQSVVCVVLTYDLSPSVAYTPFHKSIIGFVLPEIFEITCKCKRFPFGCYRILLRLILYIIYWFLVCILYLTYFIITHDSCNGYPLEFQLASLLLRSKLVKVISHQE